MDRIHPIVSFFLNQGVPRETVELLLMLPLIATLIALFRQVVGVKAFGIYTPTIITFAFFAIGIKYAVVIFISVLLMGMLSRLVLKRLRLLYLPRVAITISIVSFAMLSVLAFGGIFQRTGLAAVSIFPLLIMITLVEKFVATQIEAGTKNALRIAAETLFIAFIGYLLLIWEPLRNALIAFPWLVLATIPLNILLGRWSGLRLSELVRFREILKRP